MYNVQPFILLGFGVLFFGERVTAAKLFWLGLAFAGVLAIILVKPSAAYIGGGHYLLGVTMALLAAVGWAVRGGHHEMAQGGAPQLIALIHVVTGSLMLAPLVDWSSLPQGSRVWTVLATIGVLHTGLMYALMYAAVQRLPTDLQGALSFIYPVAAIAIDVVALGTELRPIQIVGAVAVVLAAGGATLGWGVAKPVKAQALAR